MPPKNLILIWSGTILLVSIGFIAIFRNIPLDPYTYNKGFLKFPQISYLHFITGFVFLSTGLTQFIPAIRQKAILFHRWSGRIFFISALLLALTAIFMVLVFPFGDSLEVYSTLFFAPFLILSVVRAFIYIKNKNIIKHREWMLRTFSVGLSVSVIRIFIGLFSGLGGYKMKDIFGLSFLLAFIVSLSVAEWWIRKTRR